MNGSRIEVAVKSINTTAADVLNGAISSLSGPTGFTLGQPRIKIKSVQISSTGDTGNTVILYRGSTGGSATGTEVLLVGVAAYQTLNLDLDLTLESTDFLTAKTLSSIADGKVLVRVLATIEF